MQKQFDHMPRTIALVLVTAYLILCFRICTANAEKQTNNTPELINIEKLIENH